MIMFVLVLCAEGACGQGFNAYVVDTISIENPHKAFIEKGGSQMIVYFRGDQMNVVKKGSLAALINNENIYFTSIDYYSFFTPKSAYEKSPQNCDEKLLRIEGGKIEISKVQGVDKFVLCLVNVAFFKKKQESVDYKPWRADLMNGAYIKVAYPICQ